MIFTQDHRATGHVHVLKNGWTMIAGRVPSFWSSDAHPKGTPRFMARKRNACLIVSNVSWKVLVWADFALAREQGHQIHAPLAEKFMQSVSTKNTGERREVSPPTNPSCGWVQRTIVDLHSCWARVWASTKFSQGYRGHFYKIVCVS